MQFQLHPKKPALLWTLEYSTRSTFGVSFADFAIYSILVDLIETFNPSQSSRKCRSKRCSIFRTSVKAMLILPSEPMTSLLYAFHMIL